MAKNLKFETWTDPLTNYTWNLHIFAKNVNYEIANSDILDDLGTEWRLPTYTEMLSLFDYNNYDSVFKNECPYNTTEIFWLSTKYKLSDSIAWVVDTKDGQLIPKSKQNIFTMISIKK